MKEELDILRTTITVIGVIGAAIATYLINHYKLKEFFRDKIDAQTKEINDLKVEIANLKNKDELQQQIIEQLKKHVLDNLPAFYEAINSKDKKK
jgi:hypothetical protein